MPPRARSFRPATVPELLAIAQADAAKLKDLNLPDLIRNAEESRQEAKSLASRALANGTSTAIDTDLGRHLEGAFLSFWRAANLIFGKITAHANYERGLTAERKASLTEDGQDALQEIGRLQPIIARRYARYARGDAHDVQVYPEAAPRRHRRHGDDISEQAEDMSMSETVTEWRNAWAEDITVRNPETVALERPTNRASNLRSPPEPPQRGLRVADDEAGPSTSGEGSPRHTEGIYERRRRPYPVAPEPLAAAASSVSDASPHGYIAGLLFLWQTRETVSSQPAGSVRDQALEHFEGQIASYLAQILDSRETRHSAMLLQGDKAQAFLDAVKSVLDRGSLPTASYTTMARRLMHKLSEAHDQLPTSLFINGVYDPDEHATFAGGFGDVYRASYDGKRVALKRIRTFTADSTSPKRLKFCREALVWQALRHASILPFLGIDRNSFPSSFCMVSPWMKYGTILKYLHDRGRKEIMRLTFEIAQGLDYLHSMNIVHGDLRGNNILISDEHHACLSDFGLATTIREDNTDTTAGPLASSSNRGGSMRWFAPELIVPEQFGCERFVRTRPTDVYAFACVCIELQTGAPPFADLPEVPAMFKVLAGERPERPEEMSDGMWYLVQAAWAEDFRQRPNTSAILWSLEE